MMNKKSYKERKYRHIVSGGELPSFEITVKETNLWIHMVDGDFKALIQELVLKYRGHIESYIRQVPEFAESLEPLVIKGPVPNIVKNMGVAGEHSGVGPMAAVAGAIAECVGLDLLKHTDEVIIENGGDIFIKANQPVNVAIFAGPSSLSLHLGLSIDAREKPVAVCTSSGTVGDSLSHGQADAVCVVSDHCALADAAATAIGNRIQSKADITRAIQFGKTIPGLKGLVVIIGDKVGLWGSIEVVPV
jgi:ApbE superfamily uncharacterized protein (UPF0280 family)